MAKQQTSDPDVAARLLRAGFKKLAWDARPRPDRCWLAPNSREADHEEQRVVGKAQLPNTRWVEVKQTHVKPRSLVPIEAIDTITALTQLLAIEEQKKR